MSQPKTEMDALRQLLGLPEEPRGEPTPFARGVAEVLAKALIALRTAGTIEVEDENLEGLTKEVVDAALESSSAKKLPRRIVKTLIHSDHVEEVYGTDTEIEAALHPFLEQL